MPAEPIAPSLAHRTVLLHEAVNALVVDPAGRYVDGTFGRGGHSRELLKRLGPDGRLLALDRDPEAIAHAQTGEGRIDDPRFTIVHAAFSTLADVLVNQGWSQVDGVLLDLGVSSPQIDTPERGFSFRFDAPLDMRMDTTRGETAADFLARADERTLAEVIAHHGEERFAVSIAKALVARRESGRPIRTTAELSDVVARAVKTREAGQDPATRTFQALRILVNAELDELDAALNQSLVCLRPGGRLVVISFHSLEDRKVKTFMARHGKPTFDRRAPFAEAPPVLLQPIARLKPTPDEIAANPRSRSAIARVAERTAEPLPAPAGIERRRRVSA